MRFLITFLCTLICSFSALADEQQVAKSLDSFHQAASNADGKTYFALLHDEAIFLGTDATERWTKEEFVSFAQPYFDQGRGWTYLPRNRHIIFSPDQQIAWFDELLDNEKYGECRGTGVLINTSQGWKIMQYHLTIPLPNAIAGDITEQIQQFQQKNQE